MGDGFLATGGSEPRSLAIQASHLTEQIASFIEGYSIMASTLAKSRVFRESPFILDPVTFHLTSSGCPSAVPRNDSSHKTSTVTCPSTQGEPLEKNDWIGIQVILLV